MATTYNMPEAETGQCEARAPAVLAGLILLGGFLTIVVSLYMVVVSYSSLPYYDQWAEVTYAANGGNLFSPAWLWERWLEHRHVIPKLFFGADLYWFQCRQIFLLASIFVIQLLHLAVLSWGMWSLGRWRGPLWLTGTGLAAFCLFYPSQWENFIWGFQVCFVLAHLLASLSFVALLLYSRQFQQHSENSSSPRFLVISLLAALAATYSLASGNLLWPILIAAAVYLRLRYTATISIVGAGIVSTGLYFYHYVRPGHHPRPIFSNLRAPLRMVSFLAEYLFGTWTHHGIYVAACIVIGELAIAVVLVFLARAYFRRLGLLGIQLLLTMVFCAATAMITAAGRSSLGAVLARVSRYQTVVLLLWCCAGLLLLGFSFFARVRVRHSFVAAQLMLLVVLAAGFTRIEAPIAQARRHGFMLDTAAASLLTGVYDQPQLEWVYPILDELGRDVSYLQVHQLSIFSGPVQSWFGKRLEYVFPEVSFSDCNGAVETVVSVDTLGARGIRLSGWAWDTKRRAPPSAVVVTLNGVIRGYGSVGQRHASPGGVQPKIADGYMGFVAYAPAAPRGSLVTIYAVLKGARPTACFIAAK